MYLIEKPERLLYHLEAVDIEDDEYVFWDATGAGACVSVAHNVIDQLRGVTGQCRSKMHLKPTRNLLTFECPSKERRSKFGGAFNRRSRSECHFGRDYFLNEYLLQWHLNIFHTVRA